MRIKCLLFFIVVASLQTSCSNNKNKFVIIGNINNMPEQNVVLEQLTANDIISIIDSAHSNKEGHFEFSESASESGLYRLHFQSHRFILLSIDKGNLKVIADWNNISNYNIAGSEPSEDLRKLLKSYRDYLRDYNTMSIVLDTLRLKGNDSLLTLAKREYEDLNVKFIRYLENYADTTPYQANAVFAARILNPSTESAYLDMFTQSLNKRFPGTIMTKDFGEYYLKINVRGIKAKQPEIKEGSIAPEINLPNQSGVNVTLSSLKGKYVLVDFWASWCPLCRTENPNVVAAYKKFKNKNFVVYGVSLDVSRIEWEKGIKDDNLTWIQVTDLKRWESPIVKEYNVDAIPANFLIDPDGKVIGKNLNGDKLESTLAQVLK